MRMRRCISSVLATLSLPFGQSQKLRRLDSQRLRQSANDLEACIEDALLKLGEIAPAHLGLIR